MKKQMLHSKLMVLQGQILTLKEEQNFISQILKILDLRKAGEITVAETGKRIRRLAWKFAEDLSFNGLALSSGSDEAIVAGLPVLLKA